MADRQLGILPELDRAVFEATVDVDLRVFPEFQLGVSEHVALAKVSSCRSLGVLVPAQELSNAFSGQLLTSIASKTHIDALGVD